MESKLLCSAISEGQNSFYHLPCADSDALYILIEDIDDRFFKVSKVVMVGDAMHACEYNISEYEFRCLLSGKLHPGMFTRWTNISTYLHGTDLDPILPHVQVCREFGNINIHETPELPTHGRFKCPNWIQHGWDEDVTIIYKMSAPRIDPTYVVFRLYLCSIYMEYVDWFFVSITIKRDSSERGPSVTSHIKVSRARPLIQNAEVMDPSYMVTSRSMDENLVPTPIRKMIQSITRDNTPGDIARPGRQIYIWADERTIMWQLLHTWYQRGLNMDVMGIIAEFAGMKRC
jgi:hypothetical protein